MREYLLFTLYHKVGPQPSSGLSTSVTLSLAQKGRYATRYPTFHPRAVGFPLLWKLTHVGPASPPRRSMAETSGLYSYPSFKIYKFATTVTQTRPTRTTQPYKTMHVCTFIATYYYFCQGNCIYCTLLCAH